MNNEVELPEGCNREHRSLLIITRGQPQDAPQLPQRDSQIPVTFTDTQLHSHIAFSPLLLSTGKGVPTLPDAQLKCKPKSCSWCAGDSTERAMRLPDGHPHAIDNE